MICCGLSVFNAVTAGGLPCSFQFDVAWAWHAHLSAVAHRLLERDHPSATCEAWAAQTHERHECFHNALS